MNISMIRKDKRAQTAVEYLLLLMVVVAIVLAGFRIYSPTLQETANLYYNRAVPGIVGDLPRCGDGCCSSVEQQSLCPIDCPGPAC